MFIRFNTWMMKITSIAVRVETFENSDVIGTSHFESNFILK